MRTRYICNFTAIRNKDRLDLKNYLAFILWALLEKKIALQSFKPSVEVLETTYQVYLLTLQKNVKKLI